MFIWYLGALIGGNFILLILYNIIKLPPRSANVGSGQVVQLIRSLIYAGIWITYILRAERVKNTFLLPY